MRGRFPLVAALLLALTSPAQAASLGGGVAVGGSGQDPCVDVLAAVHDPVHALYNPETVLHFASHCTVDLDVTVRQTQDRTVVAIDAEPVNILIESVRENGTLVVTIAVTYAEHGEKYILHCSDPDNLLPTFPVREWDGVCWGLEPAWD